MWGVCMHALEFYCDTFQLIYYYYLFLVSKTLLFWEWVHSYEIKTYSIYQTHDNELIETPN